MTRIAQNAPSGRAADARWARAAGSVLLAACLALLATACGGGASSSGAGGSSKAGGPTSAAVAFARCLRSNGISAFPDPGSDGALAKETPQQLGVSASRFDSAEHACEHLLPNGGNAANQAVLQRMSAQGLQFARCMRRHGVALPDPGGDGRIPDPATFGIDQSSPHYQAANQACARDRPAYMPSNAAYNAWARTHRS